MTELEHAIKHIKTRADAWAVKELAEALQSISERMDKVLEQIRDEIDKEADYQDAYVDADIAKGLYMAVDIIDKYR